MLEDQGQMQDRFDVEVDTARHSRHSGELQVRRRGVPAASSKILWRTMRPSEEHSLQARAADLSLAEALPAGFAGPRVKRLERVERVERDIRVFAPPGELRTVGRRPAHLAD